MQTMPTVFVAPVPPAPRPVNEQAVRAVTEAGSSSSNGKTDGSDARGSALARDRALEIAALFARRSSEASDETFPPLDTREVGDDDIIDPERPTVRGPEPIVKLEAPVIVPPAPEEPPDPVEADVDQSADQAPETAERDAPDEKAKVVQVPPTQSGASAPDVPEPPPPGTVDIRR